MVDDAPKRVKCAVCGQFLPKLRWGIPICKRCEDKPEEYQAKVMDPWRVAGQVSENFSGRD